MPINPGEEVEDDEDSTVEEYTPEESDIENTDDGGAIVRVEKDDSPPPASDSNFYENIADDFDETELEKLCEGLLEKIEYDKQSRQKRIDEYADALKRTGLGDEAPGGAQFQGASKVVHPMLTESCVDFASRAIQELLPPSGPVKDFIPGTPTKERVEKAKRKVAYMNWQFKVQMPGFRSEFEQMLTQVPLGGSQYMRLVWDERKKRPVPTFIPIDDVYLPYAANDFFTAERVTFRECITKFEYERRVKDGMYRNLDLMAPAMPEDNSKAEKANEKIEGKSANPYNEDGLREEYEVQTWAELEDKYESAPYLITIDKSNRKILSIVRNWEEEDDLKESMFWTVPFGFVPWRGAYHIGLNQMMAGLPAATTGTLRALLDSAHINNLPSLLKLKGANFSGQSKEFTVASVTEIEGGIAGNDDIRKLIMAIPYNPPSTVLFSLLGFLVDAGKGVIRTTFDDLADNNPNMPVGTTLALIEQGMKVMSAIHLRMWNSMDHLIRVLHRINRMYVTDDDIKNDTGELLAHRSDFQEPIDTVPTAEPEIFSDVQRFAQMQMVAQRAQQIPQLYDLRKVELMILKRTKIPEAEELLIPQPKPEWMNAVNENSAATLGRPIAAFPEQDHLGHIQTHVDYLTSPFFGQLAIIAPTFLPVMLGHLKEHIALWYVVFTHKVVSKAMGKDVGEVMHFKDPETRAELDRTLAAASKSVVEAGAQAFEKIPEVIQQAIQLMQQYQPPQPMDPSQAALQAAQINAASHEKVAAQKSADEQAKAQASAGVIQLKTHADMARETLRQDSEERRSTADRLAEMQRTQSAEEAESQRVAATNASREKINTQDNATAMEIAAAEIESSEKVDVKNGTGINP